MLALNDHELEQLINLQQEKTEALNLTYESERERQTVEDSYTLDIGSTFSQYRDHYKLRKELQRSLFDAYNIDHSYWCQFKHRLTVQEALKEIADATNDQEDRYRFNTFTQDLYLWIGKITGLGHTPCGRCLLDAELVRSTSSPSKTSPQEDVQPATVNSVRPSETPTDVDPDLQLPEHIRRIKETPLYLLKLDELVDAINTQERYFGYPESNAEFLRRVFGLLTDSNNKASTLSLNDLLSRFSQRDPLHFSQSILDPLDPNKLSYVWWFDWVLLTWIPKYQTVLPFLHVLTPEMLVQYRNAPMFKESFELIHSNSLLNKSRFTLTSLVSDFYEQRAFASIQPTTAPEIVTDFEAWYYLRKSELSPKTHPDFVKSEFFKEFKNIVSTNSDLSSHLDALNLYDYYLPLFVDYATLVHPTNITYQTVASPIPTPSPSFTLLQQAFLWFVKRWSDAINLNTYPSDITALPHLPAYVIMEIDNLLSTSDATTHTLSALFHDYMEWHRNQPLHLAPAMARVSFADWVMLEYAPQKKIPLPMVPNSPISPTWSDILLHIKEDIDFRKALGNGLTNTPMYKLMKDYAYAYVLLKDCNFVEYIKLEYHPAAIQYLKTPANTDNPRTVEYLKLEDILPVFQDRWATKPTPSTTLTFQELTDTLSNSTSSTTPSPSTPSPKKK